MENIGNVVGNTNTTDFTVTVNPDMCSVGDLVCIEVGENMVWARIFRMERYNPFLQSEAISELAKENEDSLNTVLSMDYDNVIAQGRILGVNKNLKPLKYPLNPGAKVLKPSAKLVQEVLTGSDTDAPLRLGTLIGRSDVEIKLNGNKVVARHMAILAQTGGGKTVASKRVIRETFEAGYPVIIFDIHGDYLAFKKKQQELFPDKVVKLYYPSIKYTEKNFLDVIEQINEQLNSKLSDPQYEALANALKTINFNDGEVKEWQTFIAELEAALEESKDKSAGIVKRGIRRLREHFNQMDASSSRLREGLGKHFEGQFEVMPKLTDVTAYVKPNQLTIIYLGGYDSLAQSSTAARLLSTLFEKRAALTNKISPFLAVLEEAHNLIPSRREKGDTPMPSIGIIRKIMTEGRKFGVGLLLISQRPSRLDDTTLSQCNTHLILKLTNPKDQSFVSKVMENITDAELNQLPALGPGEGIISGQAIKFTNMVTVDHDKDLEMEFFSENFIQDAKNWKDDDNIDFDD